MDIEVAKRNEQNEYSHEICCGSSFMSSVVSVETPPLAFGIGTVHSIRFFKKEIIASGQYLIATVETTSSVDFST